jgi:hypothetical protein
MIQPEHTFLLVMASCYWAAFVGIAIAYRRGYTRGLQDGKRLMGKTSE